MPNYEMVCQECGEKFEISMSFAEREKKAVCPACGSKKLEQVYSSHVLLKKKPSGCGSSCRTCSPGKCGGCG